MDELQAALLLVTVSVVAFVSVKLDRDFRKREEIYKEERECLAKLLELTLEVESLKARASLIDGLLQRLVGTTERGTEESPTET